MCIRDRGDVGCGKTLVAAFGMYACVLAHKQAAFLAPTEILAKQHGNNLKKIFHDYEIQVEVLYASLKTQEKKDILERLARNEIDILVGTPVSYTHLDVYKRQPPYHSLCISVKKREDLHVLGEPLSHPDLPAFLQIC